MRKTKIKKETTTFDVILYTFNSRPGFNMFGTDDEIKMRNGDRLAVIQPAKKVDPKNIYRYAINEQGETVVVRRVSLKQFGMKVLRYTRKALMSYGEEMSEQIQATAEFMKSSLTVQI